MPALPQVQPPCERLVANRQLLQHLKHSESHAPALAAVESFVDTDQRYLQADAGTSRDDGCTAVTAVLHRKRLVVANVGDSRAVLSRNGQGELLGCEA